jgi:nitrous oxidase accessory protein
MRALAGVAFVLGWAAAVAAQEHVSAPGSVEGRPGVAATSPLQLRLDAAQPGDRVVVPAGTYRGDLIIDKPLTLTGEGRPILEGSGTGSVVRIRAADVTIDGFDIDGRGGGDLGRDTSGIHVSAPRATIRNCHVTRALFGVYLREAPGSTVARTTIEGIPGLAPGEKGSGIHVWNTDGFRLTDNRVADARDGLYIQSSPHGFAARNTVRDLRYGLHYMFSDDNVFEDNTFERTAAGAALMYSNRITFRRNRFLHNRGFASVGLLFKNCDDVLAEDNLIADNARGIFLEGSARATIRRNVIAESDTAIVQYDSCSRIRVEDNSFVMNLTPLTLVGRRTDTVFARNYWSENHEPDLDGDGFADRPYRLSNVFDHLRGNLTAADLFAQGFAAEALAAAETTFPVLSPVPVFDAQARVRPPDLPAVPMPAREPRGLHAAGALVSLGVLGFGVTLLCGAIRRRPGKGVLR